MTELLRTLKVVWVLISMGVLSMAFYAALDVQDWEDGERRGLYLTVVVLTTLLSFPMGVLGLLGGGALLELVHIVIGRSIVFESAYPALTGAFIIAAGYYQWFVLLPWIVTSWRSRKTK